MSLLRYYILESIKRVFAELNEGKEHTITSKEMVRAIERIPTVLRQKFPKVGFTVTRAQKEILPFSLRKIWAKYPEIFVHGDNIHFGLHLGDSYHKQLPSAEEIETVVEYIDKIYLKRRGWRIFAWSQVAQGETIHIEIAPEKTKRLESVPEILFHLTDSNNVRSIQHTGLKPKASMGHDRKYSERVYLFTDLDLLRQQIKQNIEAHEEGAYSWNPKLTKTLDISIVRIDKNKLRKGTKFYRDPEFGGAEGAYYTFTHIPPEAILSIEPVSKSQLYEICS